MKITPQVVIGQEDLQGHYITAGLEEGKEKSSND